MENTSNSQENDVSCDFFIRVFNVCDQLSEKCHSQSL